MKSLNAIFRFFAAALRGAGQVMFMPSAVCGALFIAAILAGSLGIGGDGHLAVFIGAVVALFGATAFGFILRDKGIGDGLCGFNAILVGCAAFTFLSTSQTVGWLLAVAALATIPLKYFLDKALKFTSISSLTFPFIVATWLLLYIGNLCGAVPYIPESIPAETQVNVISLAIAWLKGLSEVFLIDSWVSGLLILLGLMIANLKAALWAVAGSAIGMAAAFACGCPTNEIMLGLWGFSPVLTAIAIGTVFRPASSKPLRHAIITVAATILTVPIQMLLAYLLGQIGMPVLTLPFCVTTWLTAIIQSAPGLRPSAE